MAKDGRGGSEFLSLGSVAPVFSPGLSQSKSVSDKSGSRTSPGNLKPACLPSDLPPLSPPHLSEQPESYRGFGGSLPRMLPVGRPLLGLVSQVPEESGLQGWLIQALASA